VETPYKKGWSARLARIAGQQGLFETTDDEQTAEYAIRADSVPGLALQPLAIRAPLGGFVVCKLIR
jgi:hypothetical protein